MQRFNPVLKSLWLLLVVFLVISGSGLPFGIYVGLVAVTLLAPLVREFALRARRDEREIYLSHFSSHVAYWVYTGLIMIVILVGQHPMPGSPVRIFYGLLLAPMLVKMSISFFQRYGTVRGWSAYLNVFLRGILPPRKVDERQVAIGNFSSHLAFYVFLTLTISVMIYKFIRFDLEPPPLWYMLLMVPLLAKLISSLFLSYGPVTGGQMIGLTIVSIFLIFILLSHGFQLTALLEALPFGITLVLVGLAQKFPRLAGSLLSLFALALGLFFYFRIWIRMDIYLQILMISLIPFPLFLSGMAWFFYRRTDF